RYWPTCSGLSWHGAIFFRVPVPYWSPPWRLRHATDKKKASKRMLKNAEGSSESGHDAVNHRIVVLAVALGHRQRQGIRSGLRQRFRPADVVGQRNGLCQVLARVLSGAHLLREVVPGPLLGACALGGD